MGIETGQAVQALSGVQMQRTQLLLANGQRPLEERFRLCIVAIGSLEHGEMVDRPRVRGKRISLTRNMAPVASDAIYARRGPSCTV